MLTVTQKAACEADAQIILDTSYKLQTPLGVPTVIINPSDYAAPDTFWRALRGDTVENRIRRKLARMLVQHYGMGQGEARNFLEYPRRSQSIAAITSIIERAIKTEKLTAHVVSFSMASLAHDLPSLNAVICPQTVDASARTLKYALGLPENRIPEMPGYCAEWNFIKLWHEFGHGISHEREDVADQISANAFRYAFSDPSALMGFSDVRAVQSILMHQKPEHLNRYGWKLVETLDQAVDADAPATWSEAMGRGLIKPASLHKISDVQYVGQSLAKISRLAFSEPDLLMLGMMSDNMAIKGHVENEQQLMIARRFALAAQRLSIGAPAYKATLPKYSL